MGKDITNGDKVNMVNYWKLNNVRGFSLLEVVIAIALLLVISASMVVFFTKGMSISKGSLDKVVAYNLCRNKLEELWGQTLTDGTTTEDYGNIDNFPKFKRVTTIAQYDGYTNLKEITVVVYWNYNLASVTMTTLQAQ